QDTMPSAAALIPPGVHMRLARPSARNGSIPGINLRTRRQYAVCVSTRPISPGRARKPATHRGKDSETMNEAEYIKYFAGLLAIVNPIGTIPIFIGLTQQQSSSERARTALIAASTVAAVLTITLLTGDHILELFGISLASFRVGGGILV